jgi:hypothetical protein
MLVLYIFNFYISALKSYKNTLKINLMIFQVKKQFKKHYKNKIKTII